MKNISQSKSRLKKLQKTYLTLLKEFIAFKTVSTDSSYKKDITNAVVWLTKLFKSHGFAVSLLKGKKTNPVVVAKYMVKGASATAKILKSNKVESEKIKTVLVYGHYDVQPASKSDGWKSDPFVLTKNKKGDRFVARGAVDNKGQILAHIVGVFDAIDTKSLTMNVIFVIEGNEESGNDDLAGLLKKYKKELSADLIMISDGEMVGKYPTLDNSFRGGGNMKVEFKTAPNDRHSGLFGGAIPNAGFELAVLVAKLKENNSVVCGDFYTGVLPTEKSVKEQHQKLSVLQPIKELAGVKALTTEEGVCACEQIGLRPTLEISGFSSGYTGNGFKNIVPGKAEARINVRTVYPQKTEQVLKSVYDFILKNAPAHVDVNIEYESHGDPIYLNSEHSDIAEIKQMLQEVHGKEVLNKSVGGSIPVVADFLSVFGKPIAMVSLCNDDCNMHGVDENFTLYHMNKALEFVDIYWKS